MKRRLRVGVLFGGRSGEHEISLLSAASILKSIDKRKYSVVPIGIDRQGNWLSPEDSRALIEGGSTAGALSSPQPRDSSTASLQLQASAQGENERQLDVVLPILHGTFGEDGTIQGLLELADVAYAGSGVLGSAAGMDKSTMKQLFAAAGLPQTPHVAILRGEWRADPRRCTRLIEKHLRYPVFVKPANLGSSVGISKVHDRSELAPAMSLAATFDRKLVVEQGVGGPGVKPRELEVAILGNDTPEASVIGEIVPGAEFYDYEAKYHSDASVPIIPAKLTKAEAKQIRALAIAAFRACDCAGLARIDFLMDPTCRDRKAHIFLNEVNTMPGFTNISMYPKLWQASGLSYTELIDRLIVLALERHAEKRDTRFSVGSN